VDRRAGVAYPGAGEGEGAPMTEAEWLACGEAQEMIAFLRRKRRGRPSDRKLRLFVVACAKHFWHLLSEDRYRNAVTVAERHADAKASLSEMSVAGNIATMPVFTDLDASILAANDTARASAFADLPYAITQVLRRSSEAVSDVSGSGSRGNRRFQVHLLREIIGNPFRPVSIDASWLSWNEGMIPSLAQAIYDDRTFDRLPILADALEDAGCTERTILDHCHGPGPHVRGCWVVDLILGKE
jgi:hypothetical protein